MSIQIHLLGDSIVKAYGKDSENFIGGWGDHFHSFFQEEFVQVYDYAMGGRSTRSFLNEGRFIDNGNFSVNDEPKGLGPACERIQEGDFVFMQFAHNDDASKSNQTLLDRLVPLGTPDKYGIYPTIVPKDSMKREPGKFPENYEELLAQEGLSPSDIQNSVEKYKAIFRTYGNSYYPHDCNATYKGFLKFYIDKIRAKKAIPVLVTPVSRIYFKDGKIDAVPGHHGGKDTFGEFPYVRAMKQLGKEENVIVLDLFTKTVELFEMLGEIDALFLQSIKDNNGQTIGEANYGRPAKWVEDYNWYVNGKHYSSVDTAHQNRYGSFLVAGKLTDCIFAALCNEDFSFSQNNCSDLLALQSLKPYLLNTPSKSVMAPQRLTSRIDDIRNSYQYIRLI